MRSQCYQATLVVGKLVCLLRQNLSVSSGLHLDSLCSCLRIPSAGSPGKHNHAQLRNLSYYPRRSSTGLGSSSVAQYLSSMGEAPGSIPSTIKKKVGGGLSPHAPALENLRQLCVSVDSTIRWTESMSSIPGGVSSPRLKGRAY